MKLSFALLLLATACLHATEPRVAVLVEENLPVIGGAPSLQPFQAAAILRQQGLTVEELSAADLTDPAKLNAERYRLLVIWNGNAFPEAAQRNLRTFHAAGGALILNGIPFTHPCALQGGKWTDLGHSDACRHDVTGLGTGGFGGPGAGPLQLTVPANPLGLAVSMLPSAVARLQWLETTKLPPQDIVTPLVEATVSDGRKHIAAALIQHACADFPGARDLWIGQIASGRDEAHRDLARQLLIRGALYLLGETQQLGALPTPARTPALPDHLTYNETPRPWGDTFLPKSKPPAKHLLAIDFNKLSSDERIAVTCLQGLTDRIQPHVWLLRNAEDRRWLEWLRERGDIESFETIADWTSLLHEADSALKGAVIPDPKLYRGDMLAVSVAACEDCLVASPELAERLGLPIVVDLRGRFATYAEGLCWLWAKYGDRLNHHLADYFGPRRITQGTFAYQYQWRAPLLWPCGPKEEREPGADRFAEKRAVAEIFAAMSPNSPMLGFPFAGEGYGMGEPQGVELSSRYARPLVCSDYMANLGVLSGIRIDRLEQPAAPPAPQLQRDKLYIALAMSDGDNLNAWLAFFRRYFEHPSFGKFPLAFGMGPALREVMPSVAAWYFQRATAQNEIFCDVSGAGYMQPPNFGLAYPDRERPWSDFLRWTARLLPPLGMRTIRTVEGGDAELARYAASLPFCHSIFADMGCYSGFHGPDQLTYTLPSSIPVFRAATTWRKGSSGFLSEIREQVDATRPAFINAFVHCWTFGPDDVARIVAQADPDLVFVTPSQLATLYRLSTGR